MGLNFNRYAQNGDGVSSKQILETTELQVRELHPREQISTPTTFEVACSAAAKGTKMRAPATIEVAGESAAAKGAGEQ